MYIIYHLKNQVMGDTIHNVISVCYDNKNNTLYIRYNKCHHITLDVSKLYSFVCMDEYHE